jgi:translation initiation factor 1A
MAEFAEFEDVTPVEKKAAPSGEQQPARIRAPRQGEILGVVVQLLGANRMEVRCSDGKTRNARVPGRFKRSMWLRRGNAVLVQPWPDDNEKADVVFHYNPSAANQLRKRGMLAFAEETF